MTPKIYLRRALWSALTLALLLGLPQPWAEACHVPDQSAYLSAQQESLAAYGHGDPTPIEYSLEQTTACAGGRADIFPCANIDLLAHLPLDAIGGGNGNDIWGWRDGNDEYALIGRTAGVSFVAMTDPENPIYLGNLPTHAGSSAWRDIKVYQNHAFVVADNAGAHGLQVFDLTQLRSVANPPIQFQETAHYGEFGSAHNVVINEETGFAYVVGSNTCDAGLHMVDIRNPTSPVFAGCFDRDGYTHDAQCVVYRGPDREMRGREICFASNEDSVTVVDVTDKSAPVQLSRNTYDDSGYTHQGWLTEDHAYFVMDDELDEQRNGHTTKTYIWDMSDLRNPFLTGAHMSPRSTIDHNQYVLGDHTFQANYQQGLTILELTDPGAGLLREVASFDTYPESNSPSFSGAWSVYPYLKSGAVIISDINRGLFIVRPRLDGSLFLANFEDGTLDAWSKRKGPGIGVSSPGLKSSDFALRVTVDGTDTVSQVVALQPAREESLGVSFRLNANSVDLAGREVEILRLLSPNKRTVLSLTLEQRGSRYFVNLSAESDDQLELVGSTSVPRRRARLLRVEWQQASGANANDGVVRLFKRTRQRASRATLDTTVVVDAVRLGLPAGSDGTNDGSFLVDDVLISR